MKLKLKLVVAAMAFAVTGQAFAAIAPGSTGNGELFFSIYDSVAQTSYVRDLGIDMNTFIANGSTPGYSKTFTADALLTSTYGNLSNANLLWNVAALDSTGGTVVGGQRYLSTSNTALATIQNTVNGNLTSGFNAVNDYVNATNTRVGDLDNTANNSYSATAADGFAYFGSGFMNNWRGKASFDSTAAVGQSLGFFALQASSTFGLNKIGAAGTTQFGNANGNAAWTLASNGTLSYSVPAPAAVPLPAAVWLLGSGLIGMVGVARRKSAKSAA
ncbi:VPLPA-CTERM sorting domain-containing protein [Sulfuriferula sp.]|uniref:VPLPA-CTERM sorting domain-containing protein n=1 Tax=Sulfuriferula sp. TaxID=2025307 RepID=UPI00272FDDFE|nr:VPLPA-CTERM sorting domain-containing protein [Sulfuriferula sp.]MDP2027808.1 VPLPA-CTERM sorting domain-containing protein [Sulfuriferula sp.]